MGIWIIYALASPAFLSLGFGLVLTTLWCNPTAHEWIAWVVVAYIADIRRPLTEEELTDEQIFSM